MKSDPLTGTLIGVLTASALASIFLFYMTVSKTRQVRQLQPQMMNIQANANVFNALVADVREYSKKNPGIDAALQQNQIWKNVTAAPASKPGNK